MPTLQEIREKNRRKKQDEEAQEGKINLQRGTAHLDVDPRAVKPGLNLQYTSIPEGSVYHNYYPPDPLHIKRGPASESGSTKSFSDFLGDRVKKRQAATETPPQSVYSGLTAQSSKSILDELEANRAAITQLSGLVKELTTEVQRLKGAPGSVQASPSIRPKP